MARACEVTDLDDWDCRRQRRPEDQRGCTEMEESEDGLRQLEQFVQSDAPESPSSNGMSQSGKISTGADEHSAG
ncbi:unnamed protein product [Phytophthora fragariaefolia]|uniref:Unnamed protein product n=1 Tax=Phytophthora fragariaefolia TaxID=1490495 RepID=A0A9W6XYL8_9STRA|nr:unnamed protein product [Phytophthora fragariaefolia]